MNWKHYLAATLPYLATVALAAAEYAQGHAQNALVALIGGTIASALVHGNVIEHAKLAAEKS